MTVITQPAVPTTAGELCERMTEVRAELAALAQASFASFTETEAVDAFIRNDASAVLLGPDCRPDSIRAVAAERGLHVPTDLSLAVLGQPTTALADEHEWTGFRIPREQMGYAALQLLAGLIEEQKELDMHQLVPCAFVEGETATHR